jgi:anti-sigma factor RsiW
MNTQEFNLYAKTYGSDLKRWPEQVREEALRCLESTPERAVELARESALDELLERTRARVSDVRATSVTARVMARVERLERVESSTRKTPRWWPWLSAGLMSGAVAVGCVAGIVMPGWFSFDESKQSTTLIEAALAADASLF